MDIIATALEAAPLWEDRLYFAFGLALLAGTVRGFSGFGQAMVLSAPMAVLYGPAVAVPILSFVDPIANVKLLPPAVRICNWRIVLVLSAGAAIGSPMGVYALSIADPYLMTKGIAIALLLSVLALATGWRFKSVPGVKATAFTGAASGLMGGMSGLSGPPVILFFLGGNHSAEVTRANIIVFFAIGTVLSLAAFIWRDLLTWDVFMLALTMIPFYYAGLIAGSLGFHRGGSAYYRQAVLTLVGAIGLITLFL